MAAPAPVPPVIPPEILARLLPYQRNHLDILLQAAMKHQAIIDSSDTGTGKTYVAAAFCAVFGLRPFVIGPKAVVTTWYRVLDIFGVIPYGIVNYESAKNARYYLTLDDFYAEKRVQCPYIEQVRDGRDTNFVWHLPEDAIIIFDEAHKGKNCSTANSQLLASAKQTLQIARNAQPGHPRIMILSATITDKVENFRTYSYLLGLSQYGKHAFMAWLRILRDGNPAVNLADRIHQIVYPEYGGRMKISDIKERPETAALFKQNDVLAVPYEMSPDVQDGIEQAHEEIREALEALKNKELAGSDCILVKLLRARQRIETLKVPTIVELAMEYLADNKSVVIFVNFNETAENIVTQMTDFVVTDMGSFITFVHGGQSPEERERDIAAFQDNRSCLIIANVNAGGTGLSLHDLHGKQRVALHSPGWSSIMLKQSLGRIYRADAQTDAIQRIVYCKGRTKGQVIGAPADPNVPPGNNQRNITDTTFNGDHGRVGVEELIAQNVNKKLKTIEWINNGNEDNLLVIA